MGLRARDLVPDGEAEPRAPPSEAGRLAAQVLAVLPPEVRQVVARMLSDETRRR